MSGSIRNEITGNATGPVIQARDISGGISFGTGHTNGDTYNVTSSDNSTHTNSSTSSTSTSSATHEATFSGDCDVTIVHGENNGGMRF